MKRILAIAGKDLRQILKDRRSAVFLVLMPVAFTAFLGIAFRWPTHAGDTRPLVGFADADSSPLSRALLDLLTGGGLVRIEQLDSAAATRADELVRRGRCDLVLEVPKGFGQQAAGGEDVVPAAVCDETEPDGQAALHAAEAAGTRLRLSLAVGRLVAGALPGSGDAAALAVQAAEAWREPALAIVKDSTGVPQRRQRIVANGFSQASPGTLVQFAIFGVMTAAMLLVLERRSRTLGRMLSAPVTKSQVIAGHVLAMFLVTLLQGVVLIALGQFVFGVDYARGPLAVLAVLAALALWVSSLGLFIGTVSKGQEQVSMLSLVAMFFFAAGGGAWFPLEITGPAFSRIGHLLPSAWAMDGFQNVIMRGLGLGSVLVPVAVITGYALLFFTASVLLFRPE